MNELIDAIAKIAPIMAICLFALPSYAGAVRQIGWLRGIVLVAALGLFAIIFEVIAVKTGFPYGNFSYDEALGGKLFGAVPWVVAFAYPPVLLAAFWIARKFTSQKAWAVVLTAIFATCIDLMLDPAMVALGFWQWETPGVYYGVPIINFIGWLLSSAIGAVILQTVWGSRFVGRSISYSGIAMLLFWTGANLGVNQRIPAIIGFVEVVFIMTFFLLEKSKSMHEPS